MERNCAFLFYSDPCLDTCRIQRSVPFKSKLPCSDDQLMQYLISLQAINPESVLKMATSKNLEKLCLKVSETLNEAKKYMANCSLSDGQKLYAQLITGVKSLHNQLCKNEKYKKKFFKYSSCFEKLSAEFDCCQGPADWNENSDSKKVCSAYQDVADCYYVKTVLLCGSEAADIFKELVIGVINSVITVDCKIGSANQSCKNDAFSSRNREVLPFYIFVSLLLLGQNHLQPHWGNII